jgi:hypothetical protein
VSSMNSGESTTAKPFFVLRSLVFISFCDITTPKPMVEGNEDCYIFNL